MNPFINLDNDSMPMVNCTVEVIIVMDIRMKINWVNTTTVMKTIFKWQVVIHCECVCFNFEYYFKDEERMMWY
jgi:hypothetical protein